MTLKLVLAPYRATDPTARPGAFTRRNSATNLALVGYGWTLRRFAAARS